MPAPVYTRTHTRTRLRTLLYVPAVTFTVTFTVGSYFSCWLISFSCRVYVAFIVAFYFAVLTYYRFVGCPFYPVTPRLQLLRSLLPPCTLRYRCLIPTFVTFPFVTFTVYVYFTLRFTLYVDWVSYHHTLLLLLLVCVDLLFRYVRLLRFAVTHCPTRPVLTLVITRFTFGWFAFSLVLAWLLLVGSRLVTLRFDYLRLVGWFTLPAALPPPFLPFPLCLQLITLPLVGFWIAVG